MPHERSRLRALVSALGALVLVVAVAGGLPILLIALGFVPHRIPSAHHILATLKSPDEGQLAGIVIATGVWICWALFVVSVAQEAVALIRHRPSRQLPGLGWVQRPAAVLVAAIAVGFSAAPVVLGSAGGIAHAVAMPTSLQMHAPTTSSVGDAAPMTSPLVRHGTATKTYAVRRRDTLWAIAERYLGEGLRYPEIVDLNRDRIGPDNEIWPDTVLVMPADAIGLPGAPSDDLDVTVRVQPGDSLWEIEERLTGDGRNWTIAWHANEGRPEPGGERFTDPNLIKPGWRLTVPVPGTAPPDRAGHPHPRIRPARPVPSAPSPPDPARSAPAPTRPPSSGQAPTLAAQSSDASRYAELAAGAGLLAATVYAACVVHRRRRYRLRRAGRVLAPLPERFAPLEEALMTVGRPALGTMRFLDLALRALLQRLAKDPDGALPDVLGAAINAEQLELFLASSSGEAPEPWMTPEPTRWVLPRSAALPADAAGVIAPYPCLVSVGHTTDGREWLLDLEHLGALRLTGDQARCADLVRYIAAELANNVWSDHLTVTLAGVGAELVAANPSRLAHTDDAAGTAAALARSVAENRAVLDREDATVLEARLRGVAGDIWMPEVLLVGPDRVEAVEPLAHLLTEARSSVAIVLVGGDARENGAVELSVAADGALRTSMLPVTDVVAHGLPVAEAEEMAQAIAFDRDGPVDVPAPPATGDQPWDADTDTAGALLPEHTRPRGALTEESTSASGTASCALPDADETYLARTATTVDDVEALAPAVPYATRATVEKSDPDLDEQLALWRDPDAGIAKLQLLGPVTVTAYGRRPAQHVDKCVEAIAYLAGKPHGVSTDQFANDLWPNKNYRGTDSLPKTIASLVRHWLGVDPRTGIEYMPRAGRGGIAGYQLLGVLVDTELFRRLRRRGEARDQDGIDDLAAALALGVGEPYSRRGAEWAWLAADEDLTYVGAISDVAHKLATHYLATDQPTAAIEACERMLAIDPEDHRTLCDLAKAQGVAGREAEKQATITRLKSIEGDIPPRQLEVMRREGWLARGA